MEIIGPNGAPIKTNEKSLIDEVARYQRVGASIRVGIDEEVKLLAATGLVNPAVATMIGNFQYDIMQLRADNAALAKMLIGKRVIPYQDYNKMVADQFAEERDEYEKRLGGFVLPR